MTAALQETLKDGGEGVILQAPGSVYEQGRSADLLKLKVRVPQFNEINRTMKAARGDKEALVVSVQEDESLLLRL